MTAIIFTALSIIGIVSLAELVAKANKRIGRENDFEHMHWHLRSAGATQEEYQSVR